QRPVHKLDEAVWQQANVQGRNASHSNGDAHGNADRQLIFAFFRLAHEHRVGHLQVVVESEDGVDHRERGEHVMAALDQAQENEIFAPEPCEWRKSGKRKQEDEHKHGFHGCARVESVEIIEFITDDIAMTQSGNYAKRTEVHEGVNQQINENALKAVRIKFGGGAGDKAKQHVSDVRDRRIREK